MNLYPAIRYHMGEWTYYSVKMSMRELSEHVKFASEIYEDRTLDEAIQRVLNEKRVKRDIVRYLKRQPFRFFSSIVVAAQGGRPTFYGVDIAEDERFVMFADDQRLSSSFGVLKFDGTQNYYALDGQHRLAAIKTLLDPKDELSEGAPDSFSADEISVLVIVPKQEESERDFMQRYRRLFSNLNRYAKPMDQATNIIMDEDDSFAILTRRLITEHEFFKSAGRQKDSRKIKTDKGKNLKSGDSFFTSIETLYELNRTLLTTRARDNDGWFSGEDVEQEDFTRFRPDDEILEKLYLELSAYWDALVAALPVLREDPAKMRVHSLADDELGGEEHDNLLFWPIGMEMVVRVARDLLDDELPNPTSPTTAECTAVLTRLSAVDWEMHRPPWRNFLLTGTGDGSWRMRTDDRKEATRIARRILMYILGQDLDPIDLEGLKTEWSVRLNPQPGEAEQRKMWSAILEQRRRATSV